MTSPENPYGFRVPDNQPIVKWKDNRTVMEYTGVVAVKVDEAGLHLYRRGLLGLLRLIVFYPRDKYVATGHVPGDWSVTCPFPNPYDPESGGHDDPL